MTRVLLTGAGGFIGESARRALTSAGHDVVPVRWRRADGMSLPPDPSALVFDPEDLVGARALLERAEADSLLHLAWYTKPADYLVSPENLRCVEGTLRLVDAAVRAGVRRVVVAGTSAEYAATAHSGPIREDAPVDPQTLYGACKAGTHTILRRLCPEQGGTSLAWARLFQLYGPGERRGRLVPDAFASLLAGAPLETTPGTQVRDFCFIDDVGSALAHLSVETSAEGAFNVGSGVGVEVRALLTRLAALVGRADLLRLGAREPRAWDPPMLVADVGRLLATGWRPAVSLDDGLRATLAYWRERAS